MQINNWLYNEFKHCGVDYSKAEEAKVYDDRHQKFRNYEKEFHEMIQFLGLQKTEDKIVIDLGCGTGATALLATGRFKAVYAVDVSGAMIARAREKLDRDAANIQFIQAGFLSYEHRGEPADLVITKAAFHHLPDFWKQVALLRINKMVKTGGLLYIHDVVFQFDPRDYAGRIDSWISGLSKVAGEEFRSEIETHIRDEYSTFGWVLQGMLERAGFTVEKCRSNDEFVTEYACRKMREVAGG